MTDPQTAHVLGHAIGKLVDRLTKLESDLQTMIAAGATDEELELQREDIERMTQRIEQAERLQESYL